MNEERRQGVKMVRRFRGKELWVCEAPTLLCQFVSHI